MNATTTPGPRCKGANRAAGPAKSTAATSEPRKIGDAVAMSPVETE